MTEVGRKGLLMTRQEAEEIRENGRNALAKFGLEAPEGLPLCTERTGQQLRSRIDIAQRLMGLHATVAWTCASEDLVPSDVLTRYIDDNGLFDMLTDAERDIVNTDRTGAAEFRDQAGWATESMWSLAWILGFHLQPGFDGVPMTSNVGPALNRDFLELFDIDLPRLVAKQGQRDVIDVMALEDLFYCSYHAYRVMAESNKDAQFPLGVVQERCHALTWSITPEVPWDDITLA